MATLSSNEVEEDRGDESAAATSGRKRSFKVLRFRVEKGWGTEDDAFLWEPNRFLDSVTGAEREACEPVDKPERTKIKIIIF